MSLITGAINKENERQEVCQFTLHPVIGYKQCLCQILRAERDHCFPTSAALSGAAFISPF